MQSLLLITNDDEKVKTYLSHFCQEKNISQFDVHIFQPSESSFGVEDVRQLQKIAYLSPSQSKEKIIVIKEADFFTLDAQNALLKLLEEPPKNTYVLLFAKSDMPFLPTVLSRCKKILLEDKKEEITPEERKQLEEDIVILQKGTLGEKLLLAEEKAKEKDQTGKWLKDMILLLREKMLTQPNEKMYPVLLQNLQEANTLLKTTNISQRSLLERTFFSFLNIF